MSDRLPPLTGLRAFEAAARHLSFARAAEELNVTPAALSFQIKTLEQHLGQPLFHRLNRAVALTEAGQTLAPGATEGFDRLTAAWRATNALSDTKTLTVTAGPAFTTKCLAPRLYGFAEVHPEVELRFAATLRVLDFDRDGVDVAIRYGMGHDKGLHSERLIDEGLTPMMRPDIVARYPTPESLTTAPLFEDTSHAFLAPYPGWTNWFRAAGIDFAPSITASFSQADHTIDAGLAGGGVILTRTSLAQRDLALGNLVAPFDIALTTNACFRFLCKPTALERPQVLAFRNWLFNEIEGLPTGLEGKRLVPVSQIDQHV